MNTSENSMISSPQETAGVSHSNKHPTPIKRRVTSHDLMAGQRELVIEHGDDEYRLRITGKGKLILTK